MERKKAKLLTFGNEGASSLRVCRCVAWSRCVCVACAAKRYAEVDDGRELEASFVWKQASDDSKFDAMVQSYVGWDRYVLWKECGGAVSSVCGRFVFHRK